MSPAVESLLARAQALPPMPQVALSLLSAIEDDSQNTAELARIVGADPGLSAHIIRVSNSPFYGFPRRLGTAREAIFVIGFRQVRQIVLGASVIEAWRAIGNTPGFDLYRYWEHSLAVALAAETASRRHGAGRPEEAFTAGVLHDIGILAMKVADPSAFTRLAQLAGDGAPLAAAEREVFGLTHEEAGAALAERWNFPPGLVQAIGGHHRAPVSGVFDTAALVWSADQLAAALCITPGFAARAQDDTELPEHLAMLEAACGGRGALLSRTHAFIESVAGGRRWGREAAA